MTGHQDLLAPDLGRMDVPEAAVEVGLRDHLVVVVRGQVQGQGSKRSLGPGRPWIDANKERLYPWRDTVKNAALDAMDHMHPDAGRPLFARLTPVGVWVIFTFPRPAHHYGTGRNAGVLKASAPREHIGTPDIDKALRAMFDAFTAAGVWADDKQAVRVYTARVFPHSEPDALEVPGAVIRFRALTP